MSGKIKFKIGEFSKLCSVTVKTLRHYQKIGLLLPHEVDKWTKYRYYDVTQLSQMVRIRKLKELGLSLEEIRDMFEDGQSEPAKDIVAAKISQTQQELELLRKRLKGLRSIEEGTTKQNTMVKITIKPLPSGVVASFRTHLKGYEKLGELCWNVIGPEMQRLGCECPKETEYCFTIDYNRNHNPEDIDLEYCEVVKERKEESDLIKFRDLPLVEKAVCVEHKGEYVFDEDVAEIMKYIESHGLQVADEWRFCYIHGAWDCESSEDWLTEIQVPVK